jgi:uncharacterized protein YlxW (UPF0749 family)
LRDLGALEEETGRLRDGVVKINKDMISFRAAINTLRSHSEETSPSMDDIRRIAEGVREDTTATDKRLRKIVVFVQTEMKDLAGQIRDMQASVDRKQ